MRHLGNIHIVESPYDMPALLGWLGHQTTVSIDTETTGLDIYSDAHRLRLLQFGNTREAWVIQAEKHLMRYACLEALGKLLTSRVRLVMQHASYDIQVLVRHLGLDPEALWWSTRDTKILAHLINPVGREEGGVGHSLEDLTAHYLPGSRKLSTTLRDEFLRLKSTGEIPKSTPMSRMFEVMPIDNDVFLWYAGNDAIITAQLWQTLATPTVMRQYGDLLVYEHKLAKIASLMDAKGFLLDGKYTTDLHGRLMETEVHFKSEARSLGCGNINSVPQVAAALAARGIETDRLTPKGNPSVDKHLLARHLDDDLVHAIVEGKKAGKWRKTWVAKFLNECDQSGRVHPSTSTLRARTARFSITGIPAQTLPSNDSMVRSCFVADIGHRIVAVDYSNQELRFIAAMAPDATMIKAFREGKDLHTLTAEMAWPGRGLEMRKYGKGGNFGTLYYAGNQALMDQFGMTLEQAQTVRGAIKSGYPGIGTKAKALMHEAATHGFITTWTGRRLPVDANRLYAALNYFVQSGCRDVTGQAMVRLYDAGLVEFMRLAIHDEIIFSVPEGAPGLVREIERIMSTKIRAVDMPAQAKIGGRSWGSLYEKEAV
jgi:DNA polymerase I-like protein with 3'-5' exonuclease and polymerase domains